MVPRIFYLMPDSRIRHEIDSLVVGAPDLGEMRVMFIHGPEGRFHIIKMVPDHICTGARW